MSRAIMSRKVNLLCEPDRHKELHRIFELQGANRFMAECALICYA